MSWIPIASQAVGTMESGYHIEYHRLGDAYPSRGHAIAVGFTERGTDDFNVARIINGQLAAIWWMDEKINEPPAVLARIAAQLGIGVRL